MKRYAFWTRENFELIDFHDSPILSVSVTQTEIVLELGFANLLSRHPSNPFDVAKCMKPVVLSFFGVVDSRPEVFDQQNGQFLAHPEPDFPLSNDILEARREEETQGEYNRFTLAGFHRFGWTEWHIRAVGFEVSWEEFSGDAWFVNWP